MMNGLVAAYQRGLLIDLLFPSILEVDHLRSACVYTLIKGVLTTLMLSGRFYQES